MLDLNKLTKAQLIALVNSTNAPPARSTRSVPPASVVKRVNGNIVPFNGTKPQITAQNVVAPPRTKLPGRIEVRTAIVNDAPHYVFKIPFSRGFVYLRSPKKHGLAGEFDKASGQWFIPVQVIDMETGEVTDQTEKLMACLRDCYDFSEWALNFCGAEMTLPKHR